MTINAAIRLARREAEAAAHDEQEPGEHELQRAFVVDQQRLDWLKSWEEKLQAAVDETEPTRTTSPRGDDASSEEGDSSSS